MSLKKLSFMTLELGVVALESISHCLSLALALPLVWAFQLLEPHGVFGLPAVVLSELP